MSACQSYRAATLPTGVAVAHVCVDGESGSGEEGGGFVEEVAEALEVGDLS
jgi:hypothetical protein